MNIDELAKLYAEEEQARPDRLSSSLDFAVKKNPASHADVFKSAQDTNIPIDVAERNPAEVIEFGKKKTLTDTLKNSEFISRAMQDPDFAAVAQNDTDTLISTEKVLDFVKGSYAGFAGPLFAVGLLEDIYRERENITVESAKEFAEKAPSRIVAGVAEAPFKAGEEAVTILDYMAEIDRRFYRLTGIGPDIKKGEHLFEGLTKQLKGAGDVPLHESPLLRKMFDIEEFDERIPKPLTASKFYRKDAIGSTVEIEAALSGVESVGQTAVGTLASLATGKAGPALIWGFIQESGEFGKKAREKGLDPITTFYGAQTQGLIEASTEMLPMAALLKDLKVGTGFGKTIIKQYLTELPTEQAANHLQDLNELLLLKPEATWGDYLRERPAAAYKTLISSAVGTTIQTGGTYGAAKTVEKITGLKYPDVLGERDQAYRALATEGLLEDIDRLASDTELRERLPEVYQGHLEQHEAASEHVYIDSQKLFDVLEERGIDINEVAELVPSLANQLDHVTENGGDIQIPIAEYIARVAGTEVGQSLIEHSRLNPEDFSASEARDWQQQEADRIIAETEEILAELDEVDLFTDSANRVEESITQELIDTGRQSPQVAARNAALHKAFAETLSRRFPEQFPTPEAVYERYGLEVKGVEQEGEGVLEQQAISPQEALDIAVDKPRLPKEKFDRLVESIRDEGVQSEVIVVDWLDGTQTLENGTQRATAALEAGAESMPVIHLKQKEGESELDVLSNVMEEMEKQDEFLYQKKRGKIQLPADITEAPSIISLLEDSDLSTFLHESGHFFFEVMKDIANQPNAPKQMQADMLALVNFAGVETLDQWNNMTLDERREGHEKVAEAFEVYLFEGKAPSQELNSLFQTFRSWLVSIYRQLRQYLSEDKITDEVRQVFDRMIATDDSITLAEHARGYFPLFNSAEEAGVSQEEFEVYQRDLEDAHADAIDEVQERTLKDLKYLAGAKSRELKKLQGKAWQARKQAKAEALEELQNDPVYQARQLLKKGTLPGQEDQDPVKTKLSTEALKDMYENREEWIKLSHEKMTSPDGIHPDDVAFFFGFESGDAMIKAILSAPTAKQALSDLTDQKMLEQHADLATPEAIDEAANQAMYNKARAKVIATEAKFLSRLAKQRNPDVKAAKAVAEQLIAQMKIRDIKPKQYEAEERRAAKALLEAWRKGDHEEAADHSRRQLMNHYLAKEAHRVVDEIQKDVNYVKKFNRPGTRKNIEVEDLEQIDDILSGFDFKGRTLKEIDKTQSMDSWIQSQEKEGYEPIIDSDLLDIIKRKHYKNLTMGEMRGLIDSVKNIEHIGRLKKKLLTAKDKKAFNEKIEEATQSIIENSNRTVEEKAKANDTFGKVAEFLEGFAAEHRKAASIAREMDASMDGGVMWELYIRPMNESGDKETEMRRVATERMAEIFEPILKKISEGGLPGNLYAQRKVVPGTDISMTYEQRIMFALNWGNEGNRQRLLDGGMSGRSSFTQAEAQRIIDSLDKQDMDFVQDTLDYISEFKPLIEAQEKRLTGVTPEWVEATPIVTKHGTYAGGYFPAKYDVLLSSRSQSLEAAANTRQGMKGAFNSSSTKSGYTKGRAEEVKGRPISLSFNSITGHVNEVIHRLSWQDWLTDTNRILKALDAPIREHYGPKILDQLKALNKDIAEGEATATNNWEGFVNHVRVGVTIQGMGWRLVTAMIQPTGFAQSWFRIGAKALTRGVSRVLKDPLESSRTANEKSSMMANREKTMMREVNEILNVARAGKGVSTIKASYFVMIYKMQRMVDLPTWWGAYDKAQADLGIQNAKDQKERDEIEAKSVALADQAVLDAQGGGQIKDQSKIQRGGPLQKLWTNFYSYFNTTYNLNAEAFRRTQFKKPDEIARLAGDLVVLNIVPVVLSVLIRQMMTGKCKENETNCMAESLAKEQASYLFGQMIGLRELGSAANYFIDGKSYGYQGPPGIKIFGAMHQLAQQTSQGDADAAFWRSAMTTGGIFLHLPAGQIYDTAEGFVAISNGEKSSDVEKLQALMTGK